MKTTASFDDDSLVCNKRENFAEFSGRIKYFVG